MSTSPHRARILPTIHVYRVDISQGGNVRISDQGAISFPYGAAALTRLMEEAKRGKSKQDADQALEELRQEITAKYRTAYSDLDVPKSLETLAKLAGGFPLYLFGTSRSE